MDKKITEGEVKAGASDAIAARTKATDARKAADEAGGVDETLNTTATEAEQAATDAEATAAALSQKFTEQQKTIDKMKLKREAINRDLREMGEEGDDLNDDDDDDFDDPKRPLTVGDLARIEGRKAVKTAQQLVDAIEDPTERAAVSDALKTAVNPSLVTSDPQKAFQTARTIASGPRNDKIVEEYNRRNANKGQTRAAGAGAPPKHEEAFEPTAEEQKYMRGPMALTKEEILAARARAQQ